MCAFCTSLFHHRLNISPIHLLLDWFVLFLPYFLVCTYTEKPFAGLASVEVAGNFRDNGASQTISPLEVENLSWSICQLLCNYL